MRAKQFRAVALAAGLVGWSGLIGPRIPARGQPLVHAALAAALAVSARAPLGLRPPQLWSGLRLGLAAAAPVIIGVAASTAVPPVRSAMAERDLPVSSSRWLAVRIPVGTVWSEEAAFRAALGTVAADAFGPTGGRLLQSLAFGLSHIADARGTGEPVIPHRARHRCRGVDLRAAAGAVRQPRRPDARSSGDQRGQRNRGDRRATRNA